MSVNIREAVISWLPDNVKALLHDIEDFAEMEISFEMNPHPIAPGLPKPDGAASVAYADRAVIYLYDLDSPSPQSILHELLHIHRYWVDGTPQVYPVKYTRDRLLVTRFIENSLEHLIIVPREVDYGYDPYPHWNETFARRWSQYPWGDITGPFARRKNCMLGWMIVKANCTDQEIIQLAKRSLETEGLYAEADAMHDQVVKVTHDKSKMVGIVVDALGISGDEVVLSYIDVKSRQKHETPVSDVQVNRNTRRNRMGYEERQH